MLKFLVLFFQLTRMKWVGCWLGFLSFCSVFSGAFGLSVLVFLLGLNSKANYMLGVSVGKQWLMVIEESHPTFCLVPLGRCPKLCSHLLYLSKRQLVGILGVFQACGAAALLFPAAALMTKPAHGSGVLASLWLSKSLCLGK